MTVKTEAIYENGVLKPLSPLALPEHARVVVAIDDLRDDERAQWLSESERRLLMQQLPATPAGAPQSP